jgi:hypothetical protein
VTALPPIDPVLGHAAAAALSVVFVLGALDKLREPLVFAAAVEDYRLLPRALEAPFARALPWLEAAAGAALLPSATRGVGALLALALLSLVTLAVAVNLWRGRAGMDCGCGGEAVPLGWGLAARNAALGVLALGAAAPAAARSTVWLDVVAAGFAALFVVGLVQVANTLLAHHHRLTSSRNVP